MTEHALNVRSVAAEPDDPERWCGALTRIARWAMTPEGQAIRRRTNERWPLDAEKREGYYARHAGLPYTSNPHWRGDPEARRGWAAGWWIAESEIGAREAEGAP